MPNAGKYEKRFAEVLGSRMAYLEAGEGDPIVFLHGNPTQSYLWRNVIPHLEGLGRCIAPDLIGMGDSDRLTPAGADRYRFVEHRRYLDALYEALHLTGRITFVVHDWGGALGFDWANRHRDRVKGLAYMETVVQPSTWTDFPEQARPLFEGFRSPAGEQMVLEQNIFVEGLIPGTIQRTLSEEEMSEYRRPWQEAGENRRAMLTWPREIPIDGEPADVHEIVESYARWLAGSDLPKLFVNAEPGIVLAGGNRDFCRTWPNQREVTVPGIHFIQEDSPDEIGRAIADWYRELS